MSDFTSKSGLRAELRPGSVDRRARDYNQQPDLFDFDPPSGATPGVSLKAGWDGFTVKNLTATGDADVTGDLAVTGSSTLAGILFTDLLYGRKRGTTLYYSTTDTLKLRIGEFHVNDGASDYYVKKTSESTIDTSAISTGTWNGVFSDGVGALTVSGLTGTASVRPSDAFFQYTEFGGSGFDHARNGYYSSNKRLIAAFHKISTTGFYIINLGSGHAETGINANGIWARDGFGVQDCRIKIYTGTLSATSGASAGDYNWGFYYGVIPWTFPVGFYYDPYISGSSFNRLVNFQGLTTIDVNIVPYAYTTSSVLMWVHAHGRYAA